MFVLAYMPMLRKRTKSVSKTNIHVIAYNHYFFDRQ
jgi:hypothetical protein